MLIYVTLVVKLYRFSIELYRTIFYTKEPERVIQIAICDDEPDELQTLTILLQEYTAEQNILIKIHTFENGFSLLDAMDQGQPFDIVILDIMMPGENGIDIARQIRTGNQEVELVFLTSSPEYALESYEVHAQNYLVKPVARERFFSAMDHLMQQLEQRDTSSMIVYTDQKQYIRILYSKLVYAEAMHKSVNLYLADGSMICAIMTFTNLLTLLTSRSDFIRPHRSYVVNMNYIRNVSKTEICLLSGTSIPLSRNNYTAVSGQFLNFAFSDSFH